MTRSLPALYSDESADSAVRRGDVEEEDVDLSDLDETALLKDSESPASRRRGSRSRAAPSAGLPPAPLTAASTTTRSSLSSGGAASAAGALDMPLLDQLVTQWANARRGSVDADIAVGPSAAPAVSPPRPAGSVRLVRHVTRQVTALEGESAIFRYELVSGSGQPTPGTSEALDLLSVLCRPDSRLECTVRTDMLVSRARRDLLVPSVARGGTPAAGAARRVQLLVVDAAAGARPQRARAGRGDGRR